MIRALQLIFVPFATWTTIVAKARGAFWEFVLSTAPLMLAGAWVEGWALQVWGKKIGEVGRLTRFSPATAIRYEAAQILLGLAAILAAAMLLKIAARSFNFDVSFSQSFLTFAYGFTGIFLSWFLDALPALNHWAAWGLGVSFSVGNLYHGVGVVLKPPQTKGFGLFLLAMMNLTVVTALAHALAWGSIAAYR